MAKRQRKRKSRIVWWALREHENALPIVFDTLQGAIENADPDEAVYRVVVINMHLSRRAKDRRGERG